MVDFSPQHKGIQVSTYPTNIPCPEVDRLWRDYLRGEIRLTEMRVALVKLRNNNVIDEDDLALGLEELSKDR